MAVVITSEVLIVSRRSKIPSVVASFGPVSSEFAKAFVAGFNSENPERKRAVAVYRDVTEKSPAA